MSAARTIPRSAKAPPSRPRCRRPSRRRPGRPPAAEPDPARTGDLDMPYPLACGERPVGTVGVLELPPVAGYGQDRVPPRHQRLVHHDVRRGIASDPVGGSRLQCPHRALRPHQKRRGGFAGGVRGNSVLGGHLLSPYLGENCSGFGVVHGMFLSDHPVTPGPAGPARSGRPAAGGCRAAHSSRSRPRRPAWRPWRPWRPRWPWRLRRLRRPGRRCRRRPAAGEARADAARMAASAAGSFRRRAISAARSRGLPA